MGAVDLREDRKVVAGAHDLDKPSARGRASGQQFRHDPVRDIA